MSTIYNVFSNPSTCDAFITGVSFVFLIWILSFVFDLVFDFIKRKLSSRDRFSTSSSADKQ